MNFEAIASRQRLESTGLGAYGWGVGSRWFVGPLPRAVGVGIAAALSLSAREVHAQTLDIAFNPNVKDGRRTENLKINKSNWANTIDTPPFEAYAVTCGITFTFGGLKINTDAQVMNTDGEPIPGLYAAGELVGGIFWFNYPGGSGLTNGSVFGRIAGKNAALQTR